MSLKILIVEDQFIEAHDLSIVLEKAGHYICGIAKSVDQALKILETQTPEIVLLDIFLKGVRTGIDLAKILSKDNIPFIYLSANSNPATLELAKATHPYGFLIKPFRERDILIALDIAIYRHKNSLDLVTRQGNWLNSLLSGIIDDSGDFDKKMMMLVKAFKAVITFDFLLVKSQLAVGTQVSVSGFKRMAFDEYEVKNSLSLQDELNVKESDFTNYNETADISKKSFFLNGANFVEYCCDNKISSAIRDHYLIKSNLVFPVGHLNNEKTILSFYSIDYQSYNSEQLELLDSHVELVSTVLENIYFQKTIGQSILSEKHISQVTEPTSDPNFDDIIGNSPKLLYALDQVSKVAPFDTSVLIMGETGVGKEGIVRVIHKLSSRNFKPLIKINCAAIPSTLIESELFGHEKGAFTGAIDRRIGKFEQAHGGTIFLDEIGEIPLEIQSKLLRVIQEKELERIGGRTTIKVDVRIIAATNRNLYKEVSAGNFRIDLYYRLNVFPIVLPPLRERKADIPLLLNYFLKKHADIAGNEAKMISNEMLWKLTNYSWPGNIRELQHLVERTILINPTGLISNIDLPVDDATLNDETVEVQKFKTMADLDREHILAALKKSNGRVSGKGGAAEMLNLPPTTLASKMKKLGIVWKYMPE